MSKNEIKMMSVGIPKSLYRKLAMEALNAEKTKAEIIRNILKNHYDSKVFENEAR